MNVIDIEESTTGEESETLDLADVGRRWHNEIERAGRYFSKWHQRCEKIEKIYTEQRETQNGSRNYAMLWANISVLQPAVYTKPPQAAIDRRFKDADPVSRVASDLLERAVDYLIDRGNLDQHMRDVRDDFLLYARGTMWVRYEADFEEYDADEPSGEEIGADDEEQAAPLERVKAERVCAEFVHYSDFLHDPGRRWQDVQWVARRVYMSMEKLAERFGDEAKSKVPAPSKEPGKTDQTSAQNYGKVPVWEIWDKEEKQCIWIADGAKEALEVGLPPLDLEEFFPCPRPAYGTLSTNSTVPIPDYVYYQGQQEEIDRLTKRIAKLTDQLRLVGFYPAGEGDVTKAIEFGMKPGNDSVMVPLPSWAAFAEKGGADSIVWLPIDQVRKVIETCVETRKQLIEDIYQITGISDIVRGESQASETATAQRLKSQWGSIRIRDRQAEMARFARDVVRLIAEVVADLFQPETLLAMTNMQLLTDQQKQAFQMQTAQLQAEAQQQAEIAQARGLQLPPPQMPAPPPGMDQPSIDEVVAVLRDDVVRSFKLDIETDSTISTDEDAEKQRRMEFAQVVGAFIQQAAPVAQMMPTLVPVLGEVLLFVSRGFRAGRQLEDTIEKAITQISEKAMQPPPPPQPSPDEQIKLETTKVKADAEMQKARLDVAAAEADHRHKMASHQMDMQKMAAQAQQGAMQPQGIPQ